VPVFFEGISVGRQSSGINSSVLSLSPEKYQFQELEESLAFKMSGAQNMSKVLWKW